MQKNNELIQPVIFVSHGGGPSLLMEGSTHPLAKAMGKNSKSARHFREDLPKEVKEKPKAILVISAHYEEKEFTIVSNEKPTLLFDYYGFPKETYEITYPVSHSKELEQRLQEILEENKIKYQKNNERGLDHGVFIPLLLMYPNADIPVVQISLKKNLSPKDHLELGKAIYSLRKEGILIFCSGFLTHNLREFAEEKDWAPKFYEWAKKAVSLPGKEREEEFLEWEKKSNPFGRKAHPREEHLLPLLVAVGAAKEDKARIFFHEMIGSGSLTNIIFEHSTN